MNSQEQTENEEQADSSGITIKYSKRSKKKKLDPVLENYLESCKFYLKICHETEAYFKIGRFYLELLPSNNSDSIPNIPLTNALYLYVSEDPNKSFVYYEEKLKEQLKIVHYSPVNCTVPFEILAGLKHFNLSIEETINVPPTKNEPLKFCVSVQIGKEIVKESELSNVFKLKDSFLETLCFFNKDIVIGDAPYETPKVTWPLHNTETLYDQIRIRQTTINYDECSLPQNSLVSVDLRKYQSQAIKWMLHRETDHKSERLHPLYAKVHTLCDQTIYVNKYTGQVYLGVPYTRPSSPGGILADEMGLGKSIEILALVVLNPRPPITTNYELPPKDSKSLTDDSIRCICGFSSIENLNDDEKSEVVQCCKCGVWQHSQCFGYDFEECHLDYLCPHCWQDPTTPRYAAKTTLIVTPASISHQWIEEIEKHLSKDTLTYFVYDGVKGKKYIQPYTLASYDIVLTTYEIFRQEINYVDLPWHTRKDGERKLRHPKKFISVPSPLLSVQWWRACFDEAQMVGAQSSTVSLFASKIHLVNLWCVTGTPIQQSIKDFFGLLKLLGEDPYDYEKWWKILLYDPYCEGHAGPLIDVISSCFWRTAKKNVLDQICIPTQKEVVHMLDFSPVEEYFYARQHEKCSEQTRLSLTKFPNKECKLKSLDRHTLGKVIAPLLQLRQACCHPQAVSTGRGLYLPLKKKTMTMDGLLKELLKKCKLECEEHHRQLIAAINGLAGISQILGDIKRSVELYREVLQLEKEHVDIIKTDRLQIIHALLNLADVLERHIKAKPKKLHRPNSKDDRDVSNDTDEDSNGGFVENPYNIGRTLDDDKLRERAQEVINKHLNKYKDIANESIEVLKTTKNSIKEDLSQIQLGDVSAWCFGVLKKTKEIMQEDTVILKVKECLCDRQIKDSKLDKTFHSMSGLKYILVKEIDQLESARKELSKAVSKLSLSPSKEEINQAIECHLRPSYEHVKCTFCKVDSLFNDYESCLYRFEKDTKFWKSINDTELATKSRGTWAESEIEIVLKAIHGIAKNINCDKEVIDDGTTHLKLLDNYKKEFKAMRNVWRNIRDYVSAIDDIEMAKIRMRVRAPGEPIADPPVIYILESARVPAMNFDLLNDKMNAQISLKRKKGRLLYLQNLVKTQQVGNQALNKECPICVKDMGNEWVVLNCGHNLCNDCVRVLVTMSTRNRPILPNIKCPVCRQNTSHDEICYVDANTEIDSPEAIEIKGSFSTKIIAVVKCLIFLLKEKPKPKILVFSSWNKVLSILVEALNDNDVPHVIASDQAKFQKSVKLFKSDPEKNVLLLPIQSGANGLNLIEATHVIFVEPLLNAGAEKQALGRVHRLGQTKETTFHRFIVKNTIEEKVYNVVKTSNGTTYSKNDDKEMTLQELSDLFSNPQEEMMDLDEVD